MSIVALVPARAGSKGLPGKNLAVIEGATLVARAVGVGQAVSAIDEVVVSSDDDAIIAEARRCGASVNRRRDSLATDDVPTVAVVADFLGDRPDIDIVVILQPTSPLRTADDVARCLGAMGDADTATTVSATDHPAAWTFTISPDQRLEAVLGWDQVASRRQESSPAFRLNGAVYTARASHVTAGGALIGPETVAVTMPRERAVDIDDDLDLAVARAIATWMRRGS